MPQIKDEAEAFAIVLESDAIDVATVVTWADKLIEQLDEPDWILCQISLASKKTVEDVIRLLQQVQGSSDQRAVMREALQLFKKKLSSDPTYSAANKIAKTLFMMAAYQDGAIKDSELNQTSLWAWDQLDLAREGYVSDTVEQIIAKIQDGIDHALCSPWLRLN